MPSHDAKKTMTLEVSKEAGRLKICAYEKASDNRKTIRHHEFRDVDDEQIRQLCSFVVDLLNRANHQGNINQEGLKELQSAGHLLYDSMLTIGVKEKLTVTDAAHMIINIDDRLVHIPWEIMYDGRHFLCQRFNMGRIVSTSQRVAEPAVRTVGKPIKFLVIADPRGDLEASYNEGIGLRDNLDQFPDAVEADMKSSQVDSKYLKSVLRDYDILHYAGHADYEIENPSDSGFLLHDGRLRASDIINLIGPAPLPAMVFSNACKSGHTDEWLVGEDYEKEIYGLANAFLLAGVQHYIGTFWDVQDEPSLYFALDFYKELMDGAMVGEALRKARLSLIDRYGESTVIWASYMLYGDPTVTYSSRTEQPQEPVTPERQEGHPAQREEAVMRGGDRGGAAVAAISSKKNSWIAAGVLFLIILILSVATMTSRNEQVAPPVQTAAPQAETKSEKDKRIKDLVASLIANYRAGEKGNARPAAPQDNGVPAVAFLNIKTLGIETADRDFLLARIMSALQKSGRVKVVEREIIDELLKELNLSSSQLADQGTALEVGRILSAGLLSTGSITRDGRDWQVSLRFVETETTTVKAAFADIIQSRDGRDVPDAVSSIILKNIRAAYPLKGKILSIRDKMITIDMGSILGAGDGMKMKVISPDDGTGVGVIEIVSSGDRSAKAKIISQEGIIREGMLIEELI